MFDTRNPDGIWEALIGVPFIDAFFQKNEMVRANFSIKEQDAQVNWYSYCLRDKRRASEPIEDKMKLRFYSKDQSNDCKRKQGLKQGNGYPAVSEYWKSSPTLYIARKNLTSVSFADLLV